jgi:RelE toxin of RelEB toxin-antitoxin system
MQTVVETPPYLADAERLFAEGERKAIVDRVAADPRCGVVIPNAHGLRRIRVGFGGRGKRGGARVIIYLFGGDDVPTFLLAAFAKNEKADLAPAERRALGRLVARMLADYRRRK